MRYNRAPVGKQGVFRRGTGAGKHSEKSIKKTCKEEYYYKKCTKNQPLTTSFNLTSYYQ